MKKYKHSNNTKFFNTKFKKGEQLHCIKNVIYNDEIIFHEGKSYIVSKIEYSQCAQKNKTTEYSPYYLIGEYAFFSPNEKFIVDEETYGGSGKSGYGYIDDHFMGFGIRKGC